jgi:hypothetical protein
MTTFAIIGLTFILKYGSIFNYPRNALRKLSPYFEELFNCSLCLGFWSGLIIGLVSKENLLLFPFYGAAISFYADHFLELIQTAISKLES